MLKAGHVNLVINMNEIDFIASKGAGALITLAEAFYEKGGTVLIVCTSGPVKRVIDALNFGQFVKVVKNEQEAMANIAAT